MKSKNFYKRNFKGKFISVSREDLEDIGYNTSAIDNETMQNIVELTEQEIIANSGRKIIRLWSWEDDNLLGLFWNTLDEVASIVVPRH